MAAKKTQRKPAKHAGGRPSKYRTEFARMAAKACALGATDADLAELFEVSEATINTWKQVYPEFLESIKAAKEQADARVERSLFERANGYSHPELYLAQYQGVIVEKEIRKQYPPETAACIFWLKNRQPDRWRDKVEHSGPGGGPIPVKADVKLSPEESYLRMLGGN